MLKSAKMQKQNSISSFNFTPSNLRRKTLSLFFWSSTNSQRLNSSLSVPWTKSSNHSWKVSKSQEKTVKARWMKSQREKDSIKKTEECMPTLLISTWTSTNYLNKFFINKALLNWIWNNFLTWFLTLTTGNKGKLRKLWARLGQLFSIMIH